MERDLVQWRLIWRNGEWSCGMKSDCGWMVINRPEWRLIGLQESNSSGKINMRTHTHMYITIRTHNHKHMSIPISTRSHMSITISTHSHMPVNIKPAPYEYCQDGKGGAGVATSCNIKSELKLPWPDFVEFVLSIFY
jgi:hypothetical protein